MSERFRGVIQLFVGFGDNYGCRCFKVGRPITQFKTCTSDVNNSFKTHFVLNDTLEVSL